MSALFTSPGQGCILASLTAASALVQPAQGSDRTCVVSCRMVRPVYSELFSSDSTIVVDDQTPCTGAECGFHYTLTQVMTMASAMSSWIVQSNQHMHWRG